MGKKSKRENKSKKSKKSKSKKRHSSSSPSSASSSASASSGSPGGAASVQWEEKAPAASSSKPRSDWFSSISEQAMEANIFLGSATSSKIRAAEKERAAREAAEHGAGLIINRESAAATENSKQPQQTAQAPQPPQAQDWYRRAYRRCQEQAQEQGRSLEDVAAERWGSLERLRNLMGSNAGSSEGRSNRSDGPVPRWKQGQRDEKYSEEDRHHHGDKLRQETREDGRRFSSDSRRSEANERKSEQSEGRHQSGAHWRRPDTDNEERRSDAKWRRPDTHNEERRSDAKWRRPDTGNEERRSDANWRQSDADNEERRSDANWRESDADSEQRRSDSSVRRSETDDQQRPSARQLETSQTGRPLPAADARAASSEVSEPASAKEMVTVEEERHVRQDDINQLSAQIMRAQIEGDRVKAGKLEKRLAVMREAQRRKLKVRIKQRVAKTAAEATTASAQTSSSTAPKRPNLNALGASATIEEMRAHERLIDSRAMQLDFAGAWRQAPSTADADDPTGEYEQQSLASKAKRPRQLEKSADRDRSLAGQKMRASGRHCDLCLEGGSKTDPETEKLRRGLIVECGSRVYLRLPDVCSLVDKHCLLSTVNHVTCCAELDDDAFAELERLKRRLVELLSKLDLDCVFVETAKFLNRHPHLLVEALPLPKEVGDSAAIYFNKALSDAGPEWATNRKAVPLRDMDIRRTVPRGFPYLAVEFGRDSGLVHVIEDEAAFPACFGREVIAGMLDLPHELWRKPKRDSWDALLAKASEFRFFWSGKAEVVVTQQDE